jgi:hypothetical protein
MGGFLNFERKHVLCATETEAIFADVRLGRGSRSKVDVLSHQEKKTDAALEVAALIAGTGRKKAKVALVLPLKEFQLVAVTVPPVTREAVAKVLPYSLAKLLNTSVTDHIYDWQVAQKFKDRHELTVYLFPAVRYSQYRNELEVRKKEIVWFEPDVFAACSYLYSHQPGAATTTFLCLLVWHRSLSIAVYEDHRITVVRSVEMSMPDGEPATSAVTTELIIKGLGGDEGAAVGNAGVKAIRAEENGCVEDFWVESGETPARAHAEPRTGRAADSLFVEDSSTLDILAGFGLQADSPVEPPAFPEPKMGGSEFQVEERPPEVDPWLGYLESINLEILRTGDYHVSVLKGSPIQEVFVGGAEHFHAALAKIIQTGQNLQLTRFPPEDIETKCSQTVAAICIGALQR